MPKPEKGRLVKDSALFSEFVDISTVKRFVEVLGPLMCVGYWAEYWVLQDEQERKYLFDGGRVCYAVNCPLEDVFSSPDGIYVELFDESEGQKLAFTCHSNCCFPFILVLMKCFPGIIGAPMGQAVVERMTPSRALQLSQEANRSQAM